MKLICLLSSGIDSPVAAYLMLRRGVDVTFLHVNTSPAGDNISIEKTKQLMQQIANKLKKTLTLRVIPHLLDSTLSQTKIEKRYTCLLCKRFMYRIAEYVAMDIGADGLLTGENLGQVASQTLDNLLAEEQVVTKPVIRPLIGMDKNEIISIAKELGTFEISILPEPPCPILPTNPAAKSNYRKLELQESAFDIGNLIKRAIVESKVTIIKPM